MGKARWLVSSLRNIAVVVILLYAVFASIEGVSLQAYSDPCCMQASDCTTQGYDGCDMQISCPPQLGKCYKNGAGGFMSKSISKVVGAFSHTK